MEQILEVELLEQKEMSKEGTVALSRTEKNKKR